MTIIERAVRLLICAVLVGSLVPVRAGAQTAPPFEIYAVLSLTGSGSFLGKEEAQALHGAETLVNQRGGISGTPIHFVVQDDTSSPTVAVQLATAIIAKHVPIMLGPTLVSACSAVAPLFKDGPVQYCFAPGVYPPPGSYSFASSVATKDFVVAALRYFRARGWNRIAIVSSSDATGQEGERVINDGLALPENKSISVVTREYFNITDVSTTAQMVRIKASKAQAIIAWTTGTPFGTVLRGYSDAGLTIPILTNSGNVVRGQLEQYAGFVPKELYFATARYLEYSAEPPGPVKDAQRLFYAALAQEGLNPDSGPAIGWDVALVVVDAFKHVGLKASASQLHAYIEGLHGLTGINGAFDFRGGKQRGLSIASSIIVRWDAQAKTWTPVSGPGGTALK